VPALRRSRQGIEQTVEDFSGSGSEDDTGVIRSAQRTQRSEARASRKLGVAFFGYHGRGIQLAVVPKVGMYQGRHETTRPRSRHKPR
jgi:hypothetical protein